MFGPVEVARARRRDETDGTPNRRSSPGDIHRSDCCDSSLHRRPARTRAGRRPLLPRSIASGRMPEIEYDAPAGRVRAYVAEPTTQGPHPGVVVIHELFGLSD